MHPMAPVEVEARRRTEETEVEVIHLRRPRHRRVVARLGAAAEMVVEMVEVALVLVGPLQFPYREAAGRKETTIQR